MNCEDLEQMTDDLRHVWFRHTIESIAPDHRGTRGVVAGASANRQFTEWLLAIRAAAWDEAIAEAEMQGAIQIPDNPYLRRDQ